MQCGIWSKGCVSLDKNDSVKQNFGSEEAPKMKILENFQNGLYLHEVNRIYDFLVFLVFFTALPLGLYPGHSSTTTSLTLVRFSS